MKNLGHLMDRFKNLQPPERHVKSAIIQAIFEIFNININADDIKVGYNGDIYLQVHSAIKDAIFERKLEIMKTANNILKKNQIKDLL